MYVHENSSQFFEMWKRQANNDPFAVIWVQASSLLKSWPLRLQVLCLSLAGVALDGMLKTAIVSVATWQVQASVGAVAIVLLVALWVHEETSRRRRILLG